MSTYEQTAREKWLFNYPAQVLSLYCNLRNAEFRCPWQERKSGGLRRCSFQPHFCFLIFTLFHQHFHFPHQTTLATSLSQVCSAFSQLEEGLENSLKDYYKKQIAQLNNLISLLLGNLSKGDRQKVGIFERPRERKCTLIILEQ